MRVRVFKAKYVGKDGQKYGVDYKDPATGERVREVIGTKKEADAKATRIDREIFEQKHMAITPSSRQMTVARLNEIFVERKSAKRSLAADTQRWTLILEHFTPKRRVATIRPSDITVFRSELEKRETRLGKPTSPATINRYLALLRSAFALAIEERVIATNPVKKDMFLEETGARDRVATKDELAKLIANANPQLQIAILIARASTLREGTIAELEWQRIDLEKRFAVIIKRKATRLRKQSAPKPLIVPLSKRAVAALTAWKEHEDTVARIKANDQRVFSIKASTISSSFADLTSRLGIVDLHFHDLRRTAAGHFFDEKLDVFQVQKLGDWSSLDMIAKHYRRVDIAPLLAALDRIEADEE